jgi:hypothetical protein
MRLSSVSCPSLSTCYCNFIKKMKSFAFLYFDRLRPALSTFSPKIFPPFSFPLKFPSPISGRSLPFPALRFAPIFRQIYSLFRRPSSPQFPALTHDLCPSPPLTELSTSFTDRALNFKRRPISDRLQGLHFLL